ncbi:hypothetical protein T09_4782 [Trichinella sp. T9]|nr:hypothetical protein T09_4782 [Trichinella sp. T9]
MDFDMNVRLTRSGEITQELIVLPNANISAPVTDIDDDLPLWLKKQHLVVPVFCKNQLNISAIISIYYFLKLIVEQPHYIDGFFFNVPVFHVLLYGAVMCCYRRSIDSKQVSEGTAEHLDQGILKIK